VSAPSESAARQKLSDEVMRRQNAGQDPFAYTDDLYRQHLREPMAGVYAMDNELYRELIHRFGHDETRLQEAFEESERRRAVGQTYTKDDHYRINSSD
jgi:hypothetical protein